MISLNIVKSFGKLYVHFSKNLLIYFCNFRSLLLDQCRIIKECVEIVGENISSSPTVDKLPNHDLISLSNIFNKFRELSAFANNPGFSENLESFAEACRNTKILETLMEHPFLCQGFH